MSDYFGSVSFPRPVTLACDLPDQIWGTVQRAVNGNIVAVYYSCASSTEGSGEILQPFELEWEFRRITRAKLKLLRWQCSTGNIYSFRLDSIDGIARAASSGASVAGITHFSGHKVALSEVKGTQNDLWNGKLKLLVSRARVIY